MLSPDPDSETIDAWIAGTLDPERSSALDRWFESRSEKTDDLPEVEAALLRESLSSREDPTLASLITTLKTRSSEIPRLIPEAEGNWKELLGPSTRPDSIGTLGGYEIRDSIAAGGMGVVLLGHDPELDRLAALKILSPDLAVVGTARQRFLREARAAAALEHDHVLPIYGIHEEGVPWFAMRYAEGGTLQDRLDAGETLDPAVLAETARQTALALAAAHERGIVHRDIKPANILYSADRTRVWVCDFGIARSTDDPSLTYAGSIAGTPQYMAPEQARGEEADERSDLFSLGAVLYRCATGRPIYEGLTTTQVLESAVTHRVGSGFPGAKALPRWLRELILSLVDPDPDCRPGSAAEVAVAVEVESFVPPARRRLRRRKKAAFVFAIGAAITGLLAFAGTRPAVIGLVNETLAATRPGPSFRIEGRYGTLSTLGAALAAVSPGGTIVLPPGDTVLSAPLLLDEDKPLALVGRRRGERSRIVFALEKGPAFRVPTSLAVRDLDFAFPTERVAAAVRGTHIGFGIGPGARFSAERCRIDLPGARALWIAARGGEIELADCRVSAANLLDVGDPEPGGSPGELRLRLEKCQFTGDSAVTGPESAKLPSLEIEASGCGFSCPEGFVSLPRGDPEDFATRFRWSGEGNHFQKESGRVVFPGIPRYGQSTPAILPLDAFRSRRTGSVRDENSGQTYPRLREALDEAADGATLILSGDLPVYGMIFTYPPRGIRLVGDPADPPIVTAMDVMIHALFLNGPSRLEGIEFRRLEPVTNSLPIVGLVSLEGEVSLERCIFRGGRPFPEGAVAPMGLDVGTCRRAKLSDCQFLDGQGLYLASRNTILERAEIAVTRSVIVGDSACAVSGGKSIAPLSVDFDRCVFFCDHLLRGFGEMPMRPLHIEASHSIVDLSKSVFRFAVPPPGIDPLPFVWRGEGNHYRESIPIFVGAPPPPGAEIFTDHEPFADESPVYGNPFDRAALPPHCGIEELRERLADSAGHPAGAILHEKSP